MTSLLDAPSCTKFTVYNAVAIFLFPFPYIFILSLIFFFFFLIKAKEINNTSSLLQYKWTCKISFLVSDNLCTQTYTLVMDGSGATVWFCIWLFILIRNMEELHVCVCVCVINFDLISIQFIKMYFRMQNHWRKKCKIINRKILKNIRKMYLLLVSILLYVCIYLF